MNDLNSLRTADGSFSLHSAQFGEAFHNSAGALNEAGAKFALPAELKRFYNSSLAVLDVCVGLGYNTAVVLEAMQKSTPQLTWWGLELDRRPLQLALKESSFRSIWSDPIVNRLQAILDQQGWQENNSQGHQLWGDARTTLKLIPVQQRFDLILLDAFSPQRCPQLWTVEFLGSLADRLADGGRLLTYSRAAAVRSSLRQAGLRLYSLLPAPGERMGWSSGTMAVRSSAAIDNSGPGRRALTTMEQEHLQTRAAVPFRDPTQGDSAEVILKRRQQEQQVCNLEATNAWQRRWADRGFAQQKS